MVDPVTKSSYARKGAKKILTTQSLQYSKAHNPKVRAEWFDAAKEADSDKWVRTVKEIAGGG
jgi:hypothetical protein